MKINGIVFGAITIDGKTYEHDVVVRLSGEVVKRKKKLSKRLFGSSHMLSEDEGKFLFEKGCDQVVIGSGQMCNVHLSPEAEAYFERKGCEVLLKPTPEAIRNRARLRKRTVSAFNIIATNEFTVADNGRLTSSATVAAASGLIVSVCPIGRNTGAGRSSSDVAAADAS